MGFIYLIKNNINNKAYIGQTSSKYVSTRWGNHRAEAKRGRNHPLYNSMNKYGIDNFTFKIIMDNVSNDMLDYYEKKWIDKLNTIYPSGYNLVRGGKHLLGEDNPMFGKTPWNKGRSLTNEEKDNLSRKFTKERRKRYSESIKNGNHPFAKLKGDKHPSKGMKHTKESKSKNVLNQSNRKPVVMIDKETKEEIVCFVSIGQASKYIRENTKFNKADYSTINKVCKGVNKSAYGYCWKYIE